MTPTRPDLPGEACSEVQIEALELGDDKRGRYHCALVCIDSFTKWIEVVLLPRHDAVCVAEDFTGICCQGKTDLVSVRILSAARLP